MRLARLIVFAPAAILAFSAPAQADQYLESFDNGTAELVSVSLGQGAFYCDNYRDAYGTSGPSICLFNTSAPTTFVFPQDLAVQGFQFVAGAKNGTVNLTAVFDDETTIEHPIDGSCCEATVQVFAPEGRSIVSFSVPADYDLWLFDSLQWVGSSLAPTPTSSETTLPVSTVEQTSSTSTSSTTTTVQETTTTSSTSTSSSTVPMTTPPQPPDTQPTVETTSPETSLPETTVPTTLPAAVTTIANTTTVPPTTTEPTVPPSNTPPETSGSPLQDDSTSLVLDTPLAEEPPANASDEVKAEFEAQVDIFSGEYDNYVPLGSTITVAQRRTVVAATAVFIIMMPAPSTMRRRP